MGLECFTYLVHFTSFIEGFLLEIGGWVPSLSFLNVPNNGQMMDTRSYANISVTLHARFWQTMHPPYAHLDMVRSCARLHLTCLQQELKHDASMVCPCWPQVTHRARNIEAVQRKEHDSTCLQFV